MKQTKRFFAVLLAVIMLTSTFVFTSSAATLVWPVPGHTNLSQEFHDGAAIDISDGSIAGATIVAAMSGSVTNIFNCGEQHYGSMHNCSGFGTGVVILGDDNRYYQYAHMQANSIPSNVYQGVRVNAGQMIGRVGTTGNSTGNHLHFGISTGNWWNQSGINPQNETYTYSIDTTNPTYDDYHVAEFLEDQFTVMAHVTDPSGIQYVRYAVWTDRNGQDDLAWYDGACTDGNDYYWKRINFSNHNGERGKYIIHMYVCDNVGNETSVELTYIFPENGPTISDVVVSNVTSRGYTVSCTVTSSSEMSVSRVQFPTWTRKNEQDDLAPNWGTNPEVQGTKVGNFVTFRVDTSKHNNETGYYTTHIYAYDQIGNRTKYIVSDVFVHDHSYTSTITKPATCSATGVRTYTCSCGDSYTETIAKNASNHVNTSNISATASTCTVNGYTAGVYCNDCKKYISGHQQQPLAAHTITIINQSDATQDAEGYTGDEYCTVCKQTIKQGTVIQKLDKPADPTPDTPPYPQPENGCKWCGKTHTGFFGGLVGFFHRIFAAIFGARH